MNMKSKSTLFSFFIVFNLFYTNIYCQQYHLFGYVVERNHKTDSKGGSKYLEGVNISIKNNAFSITDTDGRFDLYPAKIKGGINVSLEVKYKDWVVVNKDLIKEITLGRTEPIKIILSSPLALENERKEILDKYTAQLKKKHYAEIAIISDKQAILDDSIRILRSNLHHLTEELFANRDTTIDLKIQIAAFEKQLEDSKVKDRLLQNKIDSLENRYISNVEFINKQIDEYLTMDIDEKDAIVQKTYKAFKLGDYALMEAVNPHKPNVTFYQKSLLKKQKYRDKVKENLDSLDQANNDLQVAFKRAQQHITALILQGKIAEADLVFNDYFKIDSTNIDLFYEYASFLSLQGRLTDLLEFYEKKFHFFDEEEKCSIQRYIGRIHSELSNFEVADSLFQQVEQCIDPEDKIEFADLYYVMASNYVFSNLGTEKAKTYYEKCISIWEQLADSLEDKRDKRSYAAAIHGYGLTTLREGKLAESIRHFKKAFEIHKSMGPMEFHDIIRVGDFITITNDLVVTNNNIENYVEANKYLDIAYETGKEAVNFNPEAYFQKYLNTIFYIIQMRKEDENALQKFYIEADSLITRWAKGKTIKGPYGYIYGEWAKSLLQQNGDSTKIRSIIKKVFEYSDLSFYNSPVISYKLMQKTYFDLFLATCNGIQYLDIVNELMERFLANARYFIHKYPKNNEVHKHIEFILSNSYKIPLINDLTEFGKNQKYLGHIEDHLAFAKQKKEDKEKLLDVKLSLTHKYLSLFGLNPLINYPYYPKGKLILEEIEKEGIPVASYDLFKKEKDHYNNLMPKYDSLLQKIQGVESPFHKNNIINPKGKTQVSFAMKGRDKANELFKKGKYFDAAITFELALQDFAYTYLNHGLGFELLGKDFIDNLSRNCGYLSWYKLFSREFSEAENYAILGKELNIFGLNFWIGTYLAHSYLLQNKVHLARTTYIQQIISVNEENESKFSSALLNDFELLKQTGILNPNAEKEIKDILELIKHKAKKNKAEQDYLNLIKIYQNIPEAKNNDTILFETTELLSNLAISNSQQSNFKQAENYFQRSIQLRQKAKVVDSLNYYYLTARNLYNLGFTYNNWGKIKLAENTYKRALETLDSVTSVNTHESILNLKANCKFELAQQSINKEDYKRAEILLKESLDIYRKLLKKNPNDYFPKFFEAIYINSLFSRDLQNFKKAKDYYKEGITSYEKHNGQSQDKRLKGIFINMLIGIGDISWKQEHKIEIAENYYVSAYKLINDENLLTPNEFQDLLIKTRLDLTIKLYDLYTFKSFKKESSFQESLKKAELYIREAIKIKTNLFESTEVIKERLELNFILFLQWNKDLKNDSFKEKGIKVLDQIATDLANTNDSFLIDWYNSSRNLFQNPALFLSETSIKEINTFLYTYEDYKYKADSLNSIREFNQAIEHQKTAIKNIEHVDSLAANSRAVVAFLEQRYKVSKRFLSSLVSVAYGYMSWYQILGKSYVQAKSYAISGLDKDPIQIGIKIKLAHALLLQGYYKDAKKIYKEIKDEKLNQNGRQITCKQVIFDDFEKMSNLGLFDTNQRKTDYQKIVKTLE